MLPADDCGAGNARRGTRAAGCHMRTPLCVLALCGLIAAVALRPSPVAAQAASGAIVLVLPFENPQADPQREWLREGVALLMADVLDADDVQVVSRDERVLAFDRLQLPVNATLSRASTIKVGQAVEATTVIVGRVEVSGDQVTVAARAVQLDAGRLRPESVVRAPLQELFTTVARVSAALVGKASPPVRWQAPPTLDA